MNPIFEKTTNTIAAGAVASPIWLPALADVSRAAAMWLPILGVVWLFVQMIVFLYKSFKGK